MIVSPTIRADILRWLALADPEAVQSEEHGKRSVGVDPLGSEQKRPQLRAVQAARVVWVDLAGGLTGRGWRRSVRRSIGKLVGSLRE